MRNLVIEINNEKMTYAINEMGFTYDEAVEMMAMSNGITTDEVNEILSDEAYNNDAESLYEHETRCENAWMTSAEYDPEAQDEMYYETMRGAL